MSKKTKSTSPTRALALLKPAPVLPTESAEEFNRFYEDIKDELQVRGTMEHVFGDDAVQLAWEIRRYRRAKNSLVNSEFQNALKNLLRPIVHSQVGQRKGAQQPSGLLPYSFVALNPEVESEVDQLAHRWFVDEREKKKICEMLEQHNLDDYAIETEAMRLAASELERLDRLLASLEWRLQRVLRALAEFRGGLGRHLRASVERVIEGKVLALDDASKKPPPAAA